MSTSILDLLDPARNPVVHGNGFVIARLRDGRRVHAWGDPRIPRQRTYTGIHDHSFGFRSTVLRGALVDVTYRSYRRLGSAAAYV